MVQKKRLTRKEKVGSASEIPQHRKANSWGESYGYSKFQLTDSQKELANKITENIITVIDAVPGTGKSTTVLHTFVKEYLRDRDKQIVIFRTPVEAGGLDKVGYLPLGLAEKIAPHFSSTKVILEQLLNKGKLETDMDHRIKFKIPNYELGATWDNSLVLIDECQALQPMIMKLLLERIGVGTKVVVAGDSTQMYATDASKRNALKDLINRFFEKDGTAKYPDIALHKFTVEDVQRSEIVKTVIRAYSDSL